MSATDSLCGCLQGEVFLLRHFISFLRRFDKITTIEALRLQLLEACMHFLKPAFAEKVLADPSLQVRPRLACKGHSPEFCNVDKSFLPQLVSSTYL